MAEFGSIQQPSTLTKCTHEKYSYWFLPFLCNFSICHSAFFSCLRVLILSTHWNGIIHNLYLEFRWKLQSVRATDRSNWSFYGKNRFHLFSSQFVFLSILCCFCCHIVNVLFSYFHLSTPFHSLCVFSVFVFFFHFIPRSFVCRQ